MKKKLWEQLQEDVQRILQIYDSPAKVTVGSGAVKGNGDVISCRFMVECKQRTKKNITIQHKVWKKIQQEAELLDRIPAVASMNQDQIVLITLSLGDFGRILRARG